MDQDLLQRIDLIERMVLQARHTTQYWGWCFALWGSGQLAALGLSIVLPNGMLIWAIAMTTCGIVTGIVIRRKRATEEKESLAFRPLLAIWLGFGISISLLTFLGQPTGLFTMRAYCTVFFALMGFTNFSSGMILRWPLQIAAGTAWWGAGVLVMYGPEKIIAWTFIAMIFLGEVVFGLYLMLRERLDRRHA
jgi:hypothetical protein